MTLTTSEIATAIYRPPRAGSDTLPFVNLGTEKWLVPFKRTACHIKAQKGGYGITHPRITVPGFPATDWMQALGTIKTHTDAEFSPWSYILILYAPENRKTGGSVLLAEGFEQLRLRSGMLVELNIHRDHALVQSPTSRLVFVAADFDEPVSFEEATRHIREYLTLGKTADDQ